ncbi:MAG: motility protein A [Armatimonadota bacterium]
MAGCNLKCMWNPSALLLVVFGGLGGAVAVSGVHTVSSIPRVLRQVCVRGGTDMLALARTLLAFARVARVEGLLALERLVADIGNSFLRRGIELALDGTSCEDIRGILETETYAAFRRLVAAEDFFRSLGFFASSFGVIATTSSLVVNLRSVTSPEKMGTIIASSLSGLLYGLIFKTLVCSSLAHRIGAHAEEELFANTMLIEGVVALRAGEAPRHIYERMVGFLSGGQKWRSSTFDLMRHDSPARRVRGILT